MPPCRHCGGATTRHSRFTTVIAYRCTRPWCGRFTQILVPIAA